MARPLRWVEPNKLYEITITCFQRRFLLRPSKRVRDLTIGILGRAQRRYEMDVVDFFFSSNHAHLYLVPKSAKQLAAFMNYLDSQLAVKIGSQLHHWKGKIFDRRYTSIRVWDSEEDQVGRIRYCTAHGCKENLVTSPLHWPGARGLPAILNGTLKLAGLWVDQTNLNEARRRARRRKKKTGEKVRVRDHTTIETVRLSPLPCWAHLPPEEYRRRYLEIVREVEEDARRRRREGTPFLGARGVCAQHPHASPESPKRSPRPRYHARSREARRQLHEAESQFVQAYRAAAERLRRGESPVVFPEGAFPPPAPFQPHTGGLPPPRAG